VRDMRQRVGLARALVVHPNIFPPVSFLMPADVD